MDNISTSKELVSKVNSCSKKYMEYIPQQSNLLVEAYKQEITDLFIIAEKASITLNNDELYDDYGIIGYRRKLENNHIEWINSENESIETTNDETKAVLVYKNTEKTYVKELRTELHNILKGQFPQLIAPETPKVVETTSGAQSTSTPSKTIIHLPRKVTTPSKPVRTTPKKQLPVVEKPLIAVQEPEVVPEPIVVLEVPKKVIPQELREELYNIVLTPTNRSKTIISDDIHAVRKSYSSLIKKYHTYLKYVDNIPQNIRENTRTIDEKLAYYAEQKATFFQQYEQKNTPVYNKLLEIDMFLKQYFPVGETA